MAMENKGLKMNNDLIDHLIKKPDRVGDNGLEYDIMHLPGRNMDSWEYDHYTDEWKRLFDDPRYKKGAMNMAKFAWIQSGMQMSHLNLLKLMPSEIFGEMIKQTIDNIPEGADFDDFINLFFLNNTNSALWKSGKFYSEEQIDQMSPGAKKHYTKVTFPHQNITETHYVRKDWPAIKVGNRLVLNGIDVSAFQLYSANDSRQDLKVKDYTLRIPGLANSPSRNISQLEPESTSSQEQGAKVSQEEVDNEDFKKVRNILEQYENNKVSVQYAYEIFKNRGESTLVELLEAYEKC